MGPLGITNPNVFSFPIDKSLYLGLDTLRERGFDEGSRVFVSGPYGEGLATIVSLNDFSPHEAQVEFDPSTGISGLYWIGSQYLLKTSN